MNKILWASVLLSACAITGQNNYNNITDPITIEEHIITLPDTPRYANSYLGFDYWKRPVNKIVKVYNNTYKEQNVVANCSYVQFSGDIELTLLPRKVQEILICTTFQYAFDQLCIIKKVEKVKL